MAVDGTMPKPPVSLVKILGSGIIKVKENPLAHRPLLTLRRNGEGTPEPCSELNRDSVERRALRTAYSSPQSGLEAKVLKDIIPAPYSTLRMPELPMFDRDRG